MINIILYFLFIVLSDIVAARWMIPDCLGVTLPISAPAGVVFIGVVLTLRDKIHDKYGLWTVIKVVLAASVFAYLFGGVTGGILLQRISIASTIAFLFSELTDTGVYEQYIDSPWLSRVLRSNFASSIVDSILFISIAFGVNAWELMLGQVVVKNLVGGLWALGYTVVSTRQSGITIQ